MKADDGFFFGLGAFETIALVSGCPILLDDHLARMGRACALLDIPFDPDEMREEVMRRARRSDVARGNWALKLTLTPGNRLLSVRTNPYGPACHDRGFSLETSAVRRNESSPLTYHKTLNYGDCILEKRAASSRGVDEPVFLNSRGQISEGATSNLFLVLEGRILTPAKDCGLLPGVVRGWVLRSGLAEEAVLDGGKLARCEEAFVTNSLLGIMPVRSIDGRTLPSMERGRAVLARYEKEVLQQGR